MHLATFGVNHQTAPLQLRERLVFQFDRMHAALKEFLDRRLAREAVILSTCNRTEIYCVNDGDAGAMADAKQWLAAYHRVDPGTLMPHLYLLDQERAVRHAFRVAAGLDSMVVGEPQILGQMKDAARSAENAGAMGTCLHQLFQRSFSAAKEVRSQTAIGAQSVSMAAAAVRLSAQIFPSLTDTHVLLVGAGEMIELTATHFAAQGPKSIVVANRTIERAQGLAARFMGHSIRLGELPDELHRFDIVVSCTASSLPILGKGMIERALKRRKRRPIFMVDLAVPRDIEPEAASLDDVYLYTIDDLAATVREGMDARMGAVAQAESIIDTRVRSFMHWLDTRESAPLVRRLRDQAEATRTVELERALKSIDQGRDAREVIEHLSRALTNKLLHNPTAALGQAATGERERIAALVQQLYKL